MKFSGPKGRSFLRMWIVFTFSSIKDSRLAKRLKMRDNFFFSKTAGSSEDV